jgi:hypothetical protein
LGPTGRLHPARAKVLKRSRARINMVIPPWSPGSRRIRCRLHFSEGEVKLGGYAQVAVNRSS